MSWFGGGQQDAYRGHSYGYNSYPSQEQPQHQHIRSEPSGGDDVTRAEALRLIGELGQEERDDGHRRQRQPESLSAPLPEGAPPKPPSPRRRRKRRRGRGESRSSYASDGGEFTDTPAPARKRWRMPGDAPKRGAAEQTNSSAFKASECRRCIRAEFLRVYPSLGMGWGSALTDDQKKAVIAERDGGRRGREGDGGATDGGESDDENDRDGEGEEGVDNNDGKDDPLLGPLPERDPRPLIPLFAEPSRELGDLYDEVELALEEREQTWTALLEARRRLRDALESDGRAREAIEVAKDRARAAEMSEPCWWNDMMALLRDYKREHGHCNLKQDTTGMNVEDDPELYEVTKFNIALKDRYRRGTLQRYPHRVRAVEELGFDWGIRENPFKVQVEALKRYKETHGHVNVEKSDDEGLFNWMIQTRHKHWVRTSGKKEYSMRAQMRYKSKLSDLKKILGGEEALEEWMRPRIHGRGRDRVEAMRLHREEAGHCVHPDPNMRRWVEGVRVRYRQRKGGGAKNGTVQKISDDMIEAMDRLGFCWDERCTCEGAPEEQDPPQKNAAKENRGDEDEVKNEFKEGGNITGGSANTLLEDDCFSDDSFCVEIEKSKVCEPRKLYVDSKVWNKWIEQLKAYKMQHGHCNPSNKEDPQLYNWLSKVKQLYIRFQAAKQKRNSEENDEGAETDQPQTDVEEKSKDWRNDRLIVTSSGEMRFYSDGSCMTEVRAKQLEEVLGKEIYDKRTEKFLSKYNSWKKYKDEHGSCVHPDKVVKRWLYRCKNSYREQLRKQHGMAYKGRTSRKDRGAEEGVPVSKTAEYIPPLEAWQIKLLTDAGLCWWIGRGNTCVCDDPEKKAAMLTDWWKESCHFDEAIAAMKEHREKTGHCVHPDRSVRAFFSKLKASRRATLEKREQGAGMMPEKQGEVRPTDDSEDDGEVEADEAVRDRSHGGTARRKKGKPSTAKYAKLLSDEEMIKLEALDLCWGRGCMCLKKKDQGDGPNASSQLNASAQGNAETDGKANVPSRDNDVESMRAAQPVFVTRPPPTVMALGAIPKATDVGGVPAVVLPGTQVTINKTVTQLNSEELLKLSAEVVDEVRKRECWSSDEYSSDSDESSDDDGSSDLM